MTEMIVRVAQALRDYCAAREVASDGHFTPDLMYQSEEIARVAIQAMREPTDAMIEAATDLDDPGSSIFGEPYVACSHEEAWRAMIAVSLQESPNDPA